LRDAEHLRGLRVTALIDHGEEDFEVAQLESGLHARPFSSGSGGIGFADDDDRSFGIATSIFDYILMETLIVLDVQKGFDDPFWGRRNNPDAEGNIECLLHAWRRGGQPVIHVQHDSTSPVSPLRPGQPGNEIKEAVRPWPGEPVVSKEVHSAFIGTDLEERLRRSGSAAIILVGLTTNHCVSTTARMAANLGFAVRVVSDATATFEMRSPLGRLVPAGEMHEIGLTELHGEFAEIVETEAALAALQTRRRS
jgi:nicotinamidase-related amidase